MREETKLLEPRNYTSIQRSYKCASLSVSGYFVECRQLVRRHHDRLSGILSPFRLTSPQYIVSLISYNFSLTLHLCIKTGGDFETIGEELAKVSDPLSPENIVTLVTILRGFPGPGTHPITKQQHIISL